MKRSILTSLLVIGGAIALLAGGATFAPFTDTDSDSGDVTAGDVEIDVFGSGASLDFEFVSTATDCDTMAPGDSCDDTLVSVTNTGTLEVSLAAPVPSESGALETCGDGDSLGTTVSTYSGDGILAVGETETFSVTVTLEGSADNTCEAATGTVSVAVTATNT